MKLTTRDEIFSAMVVYGFLNFENGKVSISNKELMDKFAAMLQKNLLWDMCIVLHTNLKECFMPLCMVKYENNDEILEYVHNTEIPLLSYNYEKPDFFCYCKFDLSCSTGFIPS